MIAPQLFRWRWRKRMPERHGQLFHVLARGTRNSCMIRFVDNGWIVITSRNALRKATEEGAVHCPRPEHLLALHRAEIGR